MLTPTGRAPGAGAIAERYQALGGDVTWIGKPHLPIYQYAQRKLGLAHPARVLCVGDSIEHDIVGARGFGAAAALMLTGILAELGEAELQRELARYGARADLVIADFTQQSRDAL
jgi:ribonucleotide monophosphatase NagD (HAD superfamily)